MLGTGTRECKRPTTWEVPFGDLFRVGYEEQGNITSSARDACKEVGRGGDTVIEVYNHGHEHTVT